MHVNLAQYSDFWSCHQWSVFALMFHVILN